MKQFNSKILVFGEYAVMYGSDALAIPFNKFYGKLELNPGINSDSVKSNKELRDYQAFLEKNHKRFNYINLEAFKEDVQKGLFFKSSIPINYGLGSSGALVSAIFNRYSLVDEKMKNNPGELKTMLQNLESWYHGKSSGIDPLVSYLNKTVLIRNNKLSIFELQIPEEKDFRMFLIDTKKQSSTGFQIRSFQQILKNKIFYNLFLEKYIPYINSAITFFLEKNHTNFESIIADIVDFQYRFLKILLPGETRDLVKNGLDQRVYYLKLCGSGGGGYLLGFTQDVEKSRNLLANKNVNLIEV